jgi:hypothetical protein
MKVVTVIVCRCQKRLWGGYTGKPRHRKAPLAASCPSPLLLQMTSCRCNLIRVSSTSKERGLSRLLVVGKSVGSVAFSIFPAWLGAFTSQSSVHELSLCQHPVWRSCLFRLGRQLPLCNCHGARQGRTGR